MVTGIYSALSGLQSLARKIETTSNNVANVNTPGFKAGKVTLQNGPSQQISTASGSGQIGRGSMVGVINHDLTQGPLAPSTGATDLAISGNGFFLLRSPQSSDADSFTRTGNFSFDKEGFLTGPDGSFVQGWQVNPASGETVGGIGDIRLPSTSPPLATSRIDVVVNLDARTPVEDNPTHLFDAWDGRNAVSGTKPLNAEDYEFSTSVSVYDAQGSSRDVTVYFDRTATANQWEFLVTADPLEDQRTLSAEQQAVNPSFTRFSAPDHKGAGALLYGVMEFDSSGAIDSLQAYSVPPDGQVDPGSPQNRLIFDSTDAYPSFDVNTTGDPDNQNISLNFGARFSGSGDAFVPEARAVTQYADSSVTVIQNQDGYASGFLQSVSVAGDGTVAGRYSNGRILPQARVALATFNNPEGLVHQGNNIFKAASHAGAAVTGSPGTSGLGSIAANSLEQSNVELGTELTNMMLTRRFFQANLKIVQIDDEMLGSLLDIKS